MRTDGSASIACSRWRGSLFAREPDVEDRVLVRVVAEAPVPHRLVELLREHVLGARGLSFQS